MSWDGREGGFISSTSPLPPPHTHIDSKILPGRDMRIRIPIQMQISRRGGNGLGTNGTLYTRVLSWSLRTFFSLPPPGQSTMNRGLDIRDITSEDLSQLRVLLVLFRSKFADLKRSECDDGGLATVSHPTNSAALTGGRRLGFTYLGYHFSSRLVSLTMIGLLFQLLYHPLPRCPKLEGEF